MASASLDARRTTSVHDILASGGAAARGHLSGLQGQTVVIKYGGSAMAKPGLRDLFSRDIALATTLGIRPVVVHGGGPQIDRLMKRLGKNPHFIGGLRVTDDETMDIVEMILAGSINKEIVGAIGVHGGRAVGLCGGDGGLIRANRRHHVLPDGREIDLGRVGEVKAVSPEPLELLQDHGFVPVLAPLGIGPAGELLNINADLVAGDVAAALGAVKVIFLSDVPGIRDRDGHLLPRVTLLEIDALIQHGVIEGGMLPKVEACRRALKGGVGSAHIVDGRLPNALLLKLFTHTGLGTEVVL
ncbi:MAG TPA: acetylglutamate kinase [Methylomirabilota bacterium]|jgi:acetylglutamate kinase|nr:acetylglutamate kinase [Methylomirabilota bacterium]